MSDKQSRPLEISNVSVYEILDRGGKRFMTEQQERQKELQEKLRELNKENPLNSLTEQDIKQKSYLVQTFDGLANPLELIGYFNGYGFYYTYKTDNLELQDLTESELKIKYPFDPENYFSKMLKSEICIITETATLSDFYFKRAIEFDQKTEELYKAFNIPTVNGLIRDPDFFPIFRQTSAFFRNENEPLYIDGHAIYVDKNDYKKPKNPPENLRAELKEIAQQFVEFFSVKEMELSKNNFINQLKKFLENSKLTEREGYSVETADYILYSQRYLELQLKLLKALMELDFKPESINEELLEKQAKPFKPTGKKNYLELVTPHFRTLSKPLTPEKKQTEKYKGNNIYLHEFTAKIGEEKIPTTMLTIQPPEIVQINQTELKNGGIPPTILSDTKHDLQAVYSLIAPLKPEQFPVLIPAKLINDQLPGRSFSKKRRERLDKNMEILRHTEYKYNWEEEARRRIELNKIRKKTIEEYGEKFYLMPKSEVLLNNKPYVYIDEFGNAIDCYLIFEKPHLITHGTITGQITTILSVFLQIKPRKRISENEKNLICEISFRVSNEKYFMEAKHKKSHSFNINVENICNEQNIAINSPKTKSKYLSFIYDSLQELQKLPESRIKKIEVIKQGRVATSIKVTMSAQ